MAFRNSIPHREKGANLNDFSAELAIILHALPQLRKDFSGHCLSWCPIALSLAHMGLVLVGSANALF